MQVGRDRIVCHCCLSYSCPCDVFGVMCWHPDGAAQVETLLLFLSKPLFDGGFCDIVWIVNTQAHRALEITVLARIVDNMWTSTPIGLNRIHEGRCDALDQRRDVALICGCRC